MLLRVKVIPRSAASEIAGALADGTLKVKIAAPPERGKANEALIALLAAHFRVSKSAVSIVTGQTSALKLIKIAK
jgi:uncharacterized protein (TIGR00251 family)